MARHSNTSADTTEASFDEASVHKAALDALIAASPRTLRQPRPARNSVTLEADEQLVAVMQQLLRSKQDALAEFVRCLEG
jgi:hypothetical protein